MRKFWCKRRDWSEETFNSVAWDSVYAAGRQVSTQRRHWICKHSLGVCGTNSVLVKWKQREDDSCIICGAIETPTHVWKCPDHDSQFIWTSALLDLDLWLEQQNTLPQLRNLIIQSLKDWLLNQPPSISNGLALCQADIGWDYVIKGFLPTQWISSKQSLSFSESPRKWKTLGHSPYLEVLEYCKGFMATSQPYDSSLQCPGCYLLHYTRNKCSSPERSNHPGSSTTLFRS